jgi:hypothetical protein
MLEACSNSAPCRFTHRIRTDQELMSLNAAAEIKKIAFVGDYLPRQRDCNVHA